MIDQTATRESADLDQEQTPTRVMPHAIPAEQVTLGAMMLSPRIADDVIELVTSRDFYDPRHATVYATLVAQLACDAPTDPVALAHALDAAGKLGVGAGKVPLDLLHTLYAAPPTAANGAYYAGIVAEKAALRRLVEAGTRIAQIGYGSEDTGRDVGDAVDLAQRTLHEATAANVHTDLGPVGGWGSQVVDHLEAVVEGRAPKGISSGLGSLDRLIGGWLPGQLVIPAGRPGAGKALALDTPLPTPAGWTTMGKVQVGDRLLDADGRPTIVTAVSEILNDRPCYEVEFSDGAVIVADAEHLWKTTTRPSRRQASETKRTFYWSEDARQRVETAAADALAEPDRPIKFTEALATVGAEFFSVLHRVGHQIGTVGRLPQQVIRNGKPRNWSVAAYSRHALLSGLAEWVMRPKNAATMAVHPEVVTTEQIAATLLRPTDGRLNHAVTNCRPLDLPGTELAIPPYTLGAWLGDGTSRSSGFTTADPEIITYIEEDGYLVRRHVERLAYSIGVPGLDPLPERACVVCGKLFQPRSTQVKTCGSSCGGKARAVSGPMPVSTCVNCGTPTRGEWSVARRCRPCHDRFGSFVGALRVLDVLGNKHIPTAYLRSSEEQRRALLAGLLDTDGTASPNGGVQFTSTSRRLAEDARELIATLGYRCTITTKPVRGRTAESSTAYTLTFSSTDEVFRLERKRLAHKERRRTTSTVRSGSRFITDVRPVPSVPVRCVVVDNDDHMYLAGTSMIPTHNSAAALGFAKASARRGLPTFVFSVEMSRSELLCRLLSDVASVDLARFTQHRLDRLDLAKIRDAQKVIDSWPLHIYDTFRTVPMIRAAARRLTQRYGTPGVIVVDYIQRVMSEKKHDRRDLEVGEIARQLKTLAQELGTTVIAPAQINRGPEHRTNRRPVLSDLRDSGELEQEADIVILLHREDLHDQETERAGEADFIIDKHRNGPRDTITVAAQLHYSRFTDWNATEEPYR